MLTSFSNRLHRDCTHRFNEVCRSSRKNNHRKQAHTNAIYNYNYTILRRFSTLKFRSSLPHQKQNLAAIFNKYLNVIFVHVHIIGTDPVLDRFLHIFLPS